MKIVSRHKRLLLVLCALVLPVVIVLRATASRRQAAAPSSNVVISQLYGGGGNSGATLRNDFIELFNAGSSTIDVSNWSIQYAAASSTNWQVTNLCGSGTCTIAPGRYYVIKEAEGAGGSTSLPAPDAIGVIAMSASAGKVALVNNTTALSGSCPIGSSVIDFVGYGGANCFEGPSPASAPSNTTAELRINSGCTDTDNNNTDFATGAPNPRNSSSPAITCGVSPSPSPTPSSTPTPNCGVERWSVKTGTDPDAAAINFVAQPTTIATMRSWTPPPPIPSNNRVAPFEMAVWTVNATLVEYKLEDDSDYHIVIKDDAGNTIITEIPFPGCVGSGSPFAASITNARAKFDAMFTATASFQFANVPIQISGVGMFDFLHGQTGVAPNGIEIHPVLDLTFPGSPPQLLLDESGSASNEAAALNLLLMRDPFDLINSFEWLNAGGDRNTRLIFFAANLQLAQGETAASVIVNLVDSANHNFDIPAEDVRAVPNFSFTQVTFRLPDNVSSGTCAIKIKVHGQTSNSGTIRVR